MSNIKKYIDSKKFSSFKELQKDLIESPFFLDIKSDKDAFMLCFTDKSDLTNPIVRDCTGIIFDRKTFNILHFSFPKCYTGFKNTDKINTESSSYSNVTKVKDLVNNLIIDSNIKSVKSGDTLDEKEDLIKMDLTLKTTVNLFFVGSLIKLYFINGGWKMATSKNLDASHNFWSSKLPFSELFIDCITESHPDEDSYFNFLMKLDPNCCYTYIIQHPANDSVIKSAMPVAFILNKVNVVTLDEEIPDSINFVLPETTVESILSRDLGVTENYLICQFDENNKIVNRIKIMSEKFIRLKELYGNYPDIGLRYIEFSIIDSINKNNNKTNNLIETFSEYTNCFKKIDMLWNKAISNIQKTYINTFVKKTLKIKNVPLIYKKFIIDLHKSYLNDRIPINVNIIETKLREIDNPKDISYIITYIYQK